MQELTQNKPFQFKKNKRNRFTEQAEKYYRKIALQKMKDKKRLRRIVKLRRIHLQRYISVKYKGGKWWDKLMKIYFDPVTKEELLSCKENTTSEIMLYISQHNTRTRSYAQMFIFQDYPELVHHNTLKFLFHRSIENHSVDSDIYELVVYEYKLNPFNQQFEECYIMDPRAAKLPPAYKLATIRVQNIQQEHDMRVEYRANVSLVYVTSIRDMDVVDSCLDYQQVYKAHGYNHTECELTLLPKKLSQIHKENHKLWDKLIKNYEAQTSQLQNLKKWESEIEGLQTRLACRDRMLFFKKGFSNKTQDQLQQALQQLQLQQKRLIYSRRIKRTNRLASYNDCKICFYPEVKQTNQIVFCTTCHVSYHINCYGLKKIDKAEMYICDACLYMEQKDWAYDDFQLRPHCQICYAKQQFPLKQVEGHFYHVTCLYFYNMGATRSFQVQINQSGIEWIGRSVKENKKPRCAYCLPQSMQNGLTLKCVQQGCQYHFHPLCAYLRGCQFQILRLQQLSISVRCHLHTFLGQQDDEIRQVYLRRFFCNYKHIQKLNQEQFKPLYRDEVSQIKMQLRKLEGDGFRWEGYDSVRKKQRELKMIERQKQREKYRSMTIEQLLKAAASNPTQQQLQPFENELQIYQQAQQAQLLLDQTQNE